MTNLLFVSSLLSGNVRAPHEAVYIFIVKGASSHIMTHPTYESFATWLSLSTDRPISYVFPGSNVIELNFASYLFLSQVIQLAINRSNY